jgi:hypothetical protein
MSVQYHIMCFASLFREAVWSEKWAWKTVGRGFESIPAAWKRKPVESMHMEAYYKIMFEVFRLPFMQSMKHCVKGRHEYRI